MGATLYAALVMHSYVMSLICCAIQARSITITTPWLFVRPLTGVEFVLFEGAAYKGDDGRSTTFEACCQCSWLVPGLSDWAAVLQVVALLYYALSYFPGGSAGVRFVLNMFISGFWQCCLTVQKAVFR